MFAGQHNTREHTRATRSSIHTRRLSRSLIATVALAVALVGSAAVAVAPASAATPAWKVVANPNPVGSNGVALTSVSCPSAKSCFAVGFSDYTAGKSPATALIEDWNGSKWSIMPSSTSVDSPSLLGVSCPSPTSCFAVGYAQGNKPKTLVEHWNGSRWSTMTSPNPTNTTANSEFPALTAVSCPSTNSCFAVGTSDDQFFGVTTGDDTLVEHWNGNRWSIMASPNPSGDSVGAHLLAVSCPTTTSCVAVGNYSDNSPSGVIFGAVAEHLTGTTWSLDATPTVSVDDFLGGVACVNATSCFAVGNTGGAALLEHWQGTSWSVVTGAVNAGLFSAIACPAVASCFAVGDTALGGNSLVEHWNGTAWSGMTTPNPAHSDGTDLSGVACPNLRTCVAVGLYQTAHTLFGGLSKSLVEQYG